MRVGGIGQHRAFALEDEAGRFDFRLHDGRIDAVQRVGRRDARARRRDVIDDDEDAARLQRVEDQLVEGRDIRVAEKGRVEIVVVLRGPDDIDVGERGDVEVFGGAEARPSPVEVGKSEVEVVGERGAGRRVAGPRT